MSTNLELLYRASARLDPAIRGRLQKYIEHARRPPAPARPPLPLTVALPPGWVGPSCTNDVFLPGPERRSPAALAAGLPLDLRAAVERVLADCCSELGLQYGEAMLAAAIVPLAE